MVIVKGWIGIAIFEFDSWRFLELLLPLLFSVSVLLLAMDVDPRRALQFNAPLARKRMAGIIAQRFMANGLLACLTDDYYWRRIVATVVF